MWQWLHFTSYFGSVHAFRFICQIKSSHLAPAGEGPLHAELLVTGLGVYWPFGKLGTHVIGHRSGDSRGFQLLAGHPAGLDTSPTAPRTGRPGGHHPPGERRRIRAAAEGQALDRGMMPYVLRKRACTSLCSHHTATNTFPRYTRKSENGPPKESTSNPCKCYHIWTKGL